MFNKKEIKELSEKVDALSEKVDKILNILSTTEVEIPSDEEMYAQAKNLVISTGNASVSFVQRKLRIGYSRAARLMDKLEERGVVSYTDNVGWALVNKENI